MSIRYKRLDDWKLELIGKTFTFLTVIDVIQIINNKNKKRYVAVCKCKCGNECNVDVYGVTTGHNKSCGCYETSKENSDRHKEINKNNKELRSASRKKWCENNPEILKEIGRKRSEWCKNNKDKIAIQSDNYKQWCKENPDKLKERNDKIKQWRANNPDKVSDMIYKQSLWRNDKEKLRLAIEKYKHTINSNPNILINSGKKISEWYKNNPDRVSDKIDKRKEWYKNNVESITKLSNTVKEWYKNNPDKVAAFRDAHQIKFLEDRLNTDFSKLLNIIHPSQVNDLINGNLTSSSNILTKCPICGEYCQHSLHNVFTFNKADFRTGNPPLCSKCRAELSTSHYEQEIADYISTFYNGELIRNSRNIIYPFELDLYYPENKIAVEFNGDYWHDENHKQKDYHYDKFKACLNNRILLVSIFESFWNNDKHSIKKYIYDTFNNIENPLSYINNNKNMLNNNYPVNSVVDLISKNNCKFIEHYYECNTSRVYTCGYTEIIMYE